MKFLETCDNIIINVDEISSIGPHDEDSTVRMTNGMLYDFLKVPETFKLPDGTAMDFGADELKLLHRCAAIIIIQWFSESDFKDYTEFEAEVWEEFDARYQNMIEKKEGENG